MLTKVYLSVAFLFTSSSLQVAMLEASEHSGLRDNTPTSYLLLCSLLKWPGDLVIQFSFHLWKLYAALVFFLSVIRNSARIEQLLTVVTSHQWFNF